MQINYDLRSLFRDTKAVEIDALKRDCEMKAFLAIAQAKIWDPFRSGKHDITKAWQHGAELWALK